jgi:hypothetical protein
MSSILNRDKRVGYKMMGVSLPPSTHTYITLYCLSKGIKQSELFTLLIEQWMVDVQHGNGAEVLLINTLVKRISENWIRKRRKNPKLKFETFKGKAEQELVAKRLHPKFIEEVLTKLQERYGKN